MFEVGDHVKCDIFVRYKGPYIVFKVFETKVIVCSDNDRPVFYTVPKDRVTKC